MDQVLLDDGFKDIGGAVMIPSSLRIHHCDGPLGAALQAIGLGAKDRGLRPDESQLFESTFQKFPRREACLGVAALGLSGIYAEEEMPLERGNAEVLGDRAQLIGGTGHAGN
jgi:hypothetical protein